MALPEFSMRQLLESGAHFGHRQQRWNPKMASYIYGQRNDIHILDLTQTVPLLHRALVTLREVAAGKISQGQFRSIYKSESFPSAGFGYSHKLKPELAEKIRTAILGFNFAGTSVEKHFPGRVKFIPVNFKEDWALIRQFDNSTGTKHELP